MKRLLFVLLIIGSPVMAVNTLPGYVDSLESRDTGYHGVWLSVDIPTQVGEVCTNYDRAVVVETDPGSKTQISILLAALASGKKVVVGVSGCSQLGVVGSGLTAPRVIKAQIYAE